MSEVKIDKGLVQQKKISEEIENYISKLDFGLLGFLWCQGTKEDKARFLFNLLKNTKSEEDSIDYILTWRNKNLEYSFKKLMYLSVEFPIEVYQEFENTVVFELATIKAEFDDFEKKYSLICNKPFYDFNQFRHKISYVDLYEDWFVDPIFGDYTATLTKDQFVKRLSHKKKINWIFNSYDIKN